jgi:capsular exopolysaccharide synthesis family protein
VTSPGSQEGKTTTTTNLGIALAQIGLKILLVDADLRKPRLHEVFQISQKPGLSEYLIGKASFEKIIQATEIPGVWVVTSGTLPKNPAELLGLPAMQQFIKHATEKFDRVLLDAPPVIPVTDAVVLSALTGNVLAIASSGKTPRQALYRLMSVVQDVHAKVLGVILNNVPTHNITAYGYGYGVYRYGEPSKPAPKGNRLETAFNLVSRLFVELKGERSPRRRSVGTDAKKQ